MKKQPLIMIVLSASLLFGCGKKVEEQKKGPPATIVTVAKSQVQTVEVLQESVGVIDTDSAPTLSAEVSAKVEQVLADTGDLVKPGQVLAILDKKDLSNALKVAQAEAARIDALLESQRKSTERNRQLAAQNFISPTKLDDSVALLNALEAQLKASRAAQDIASHNLSKIKVVAPVASRVEQRFISKGDYVTPGKPLFLLATSQNLMVRLPFPEGVADQIKPGLTVRLTTPTAPNKSVVGKVQEVRTMVGAANRAFEAIVEVANPGDWKPGASVTAALVVAEHPGAVVVPEASLVLRPAGKVVYVIENDKAMQRLVSVGERIGGVVEITSGLKEGEMVAVDGAGFLTDKAVVKIQNSQSDNSNAEARK
ncbi:efflux RND transporter periplasmic adaptor subunit [Sulfurirhabdus autotrophica]|uniref:RND family efflux transporter MFP subunit n=1 Tax=Sulfurirhabdus autotrophica TaxID=1706046 RepID=A0A4R3Y6B5_9PROT|nr:efflux RND transporter periplasmic adaptor subunit [Sulfurirhabdus autotrophica]TCV86398.1 RND family efflux transporter MFP subunit [Sulfurirhabdus autotrophica]